MSKDEVERRQACDDGSEKRPHEMKPCVHGPRWITEVNIAQDHGRHVHIDYRAPAQQPDHDSSEVRSAHTSVYAAGRRDTTTHRRAGRPVVRTRTFGPERSLSEPVRCCLPRDHVAQPGGHQRAELRRDPLGDRGGNPLCVGAFNRALHHIHHVYWRLDFDIRTPGHNTVEEFNDPPIVGGSNWHTKTFEIRRARDPQHHRRWRVRNVPTGEAYTLVPGRNDGVATAYGVGDLWVLRYKSNEIDDGQG